MAELTTQYSNKDFVSDQEVRWCPGCGDNAILRALQKALPLIDKKKEDYAFISGIGCSSRFPYYMDTYGFHTIHGRANAIATGVKMANPDLSVWVITGDGDALAIGGNHFIHSIRRNMDLNVILFNNEIYGLTKGQFSPTSKLGIRTKSSPQGTISQPFIPGTLAIGAGVAFFARTVDVKPKHMTATFVEAEKHIGLSLVEILQNCVIFNDKVFSDITAKENQANTILWLEHGKPMLFGEDNKKGLRINGLKLEVVTIGENGITEDDILVHDSKMEDPTIHNMLARLHPPEFPEVLGVIRNVRKPVYDRMAIQQIEEVRKSSPFKNVNELIHSGETWIVE
jgi:2-oxoglutarate/2-oxoacid ferredoxin oxidoreductase subunit beta